MSTGNFDNWAGEIAEIGPIYPFVGTESILVIIAVFFWLYWHVKQTKLEAEELKKEEDEFKSNKEALEELINKQKYDH